MKAKVILSSVALLGLIACDSTANKVIKPKNIDQISIFTSNDTVLEKTYDWARNMALSYAHDGADPVGCWYEAALPQREAFCMRDVSHQSVGAHILGLHKHNKNMMLRFAENISESKDWCTYWEINRYNKPAPADYLSDDAFWYNLNANFDVLQACLKLYDWTDDMDYLTDPCLKNFYDKSMTTYVNRWKLEPENIMNRPLYMNQSDSFDIKQNFHTCRGLASYVENFQGLTASVDLLSTIYAGHKAYGEMLDYLGESEQGRNYKKLALAYQRILEDKWWNSDINSYNTFWTEKGEFYRGEGVPFVLWFESVQNEERIRLAVKDILQQEWNVENMSAFPMLFYRLGYYDEALKYLLLLPRVNRAEYPEVSYGVVEGIVSGAMGILPSSRTNQISTLSRLPKQETTASIKNVPVFGGYISVEHNGLSETKMTNNTGKNIVWKASFRGDYRQIKAGHELMMPKKEKDVFGNTLSTVQVELNHGKELRLSAIE